MAGKIVLLKYLFWILRSAYIFMSYAIHLVMQECMHYTRWILCNSTKWRQIHECAALKIHFARNWISNAFYSFILACTEIKTARKYQRKVFRLRVSPRADISLTLSCITLKKEEKNHQTSHIGAGPLQSSKQHWARTLSNQLSNQGRAHSNQVSNQGRAHSNHPT
jgi:hypothetical protein